MKKSRKVNSGKTIVTKVTFLDGGNRLIFEGKPKTFVHVEGMVKTIGLGGISYIQVEGHKMFFYIHGGGPIVVKRFKDAKEALKIIATAVRNGKRNVRFSADDFYELNANNSYNFPSIEEIFGKQDLKVYEYFKTHVGMLKKEWNVLKTGQLPKRLNNMTFIYACSHIMAKPKAYTRSGIEFWTNLFKNEKHKGTNKTA